MSILLNNIRRLFNETGIDLSNISVHSAVHLQEIKERLSRCENDEEIKILLNQLNTKELTLFNQENDEEFNLPDNIDVLLNEIDTAEKEISSEVYNALLDDRNRLSALCKYQIDEKDKQFNRLNTEINLKNSQINSLDRELVLLRLDICNLKADKIDLQRQLVALQNKLNMSLWDKILNSNILNSFVNFKFQITILATVSLICFVIGYIARGSRRENRLIITSEKKRKDNCKLKK